MVRSEYSQPSFFFLGGESTTNPIYSKSKKSPPSPSLSFKITKYSSEALTFSHLAYPSPSWPSFSLLRLLASFPWANSGARAREIIPVVRPRSSAIIPAVGRQSPGVRAFFELPRNQLFRASVVIRVCVPRWWWIFVFFFAPPWRRRQLQTLCELHTHTHTHFEGGLIDYGWC